MAEAKTYFLKLTSAIALNSELRRAGSIVSVGEALAKNLLHRGKAELATAADIAKGGFSAPADEGAEGGTDPKPSEGLSTAQLKEALAAKGIAIPEGAKKPDLAALLDAAPAEEGAK